MPNKLNHLGKIEYDKPKISAVDRQNSSNAIELTPQLAVINQQMLYLRAANVTEMTRQVIKDA